MATIENLDILVKEFDDHNKDIEKRLLAVEDKNLKKADIEEISRILHSYKGLLGFLGNEFSDLVSLVHGFEDRFLEQQKSKKLSKEFFQEFIELVDSFKRLVLILPEDTSKSQIISLFPQIKKPSKKNGVKLEKVFTLYLYVDENLKMKSSKVMSMLNILKMHCTINDTNPTSAMLLDNFDAFSKVEITLTTRKTEADIKTVISKFQDVKKFELIEDNPNPRKNAPEEISGSRVSKMDYSINSEEMIKISGILEEFIRMEKVMQKVNTYNLPKHEQQLLNSFKRKILEAQESITISKELPLKVALDPLHRLVRDIAKKYDKEVQFFTAGEDIAVNRTILEKLSDPLVILLNNSIAHGIETEAERKKTGKNSKGIIRIEANQNQGNTSIKIFDNGRGIDFQKVWEKASAKGLVEGYYSEAKAKQVLFLPGFSTSDEVSHIAGRGMGLAQVRKFILEMNGNLSISSNLGKNTTFEMIFPVQNSIASTILVDINQYHFGFPETHIRKIFRIKKDNLTAELLNTIAFPFEFGETRIKTINLPKIFNEDVESLEEGSILLWNNGLEEIGFFVNDIVTFEEMAINYSDPVAEISPIFAGTASVGSGDIVFLLQPQAFMESYNF